MKKIIVLFILSLLLTGCSVNYEIEIYDKQVRESIDIYEINSNTFEESKENINKILSEDAFMGINFDFSENLKKSKEFYTLSDNNKYNFSEYKTQLSQIDKYCRATRYVDDGKYIEMKTYGYLKLFEQYNFLDEIKLVIKSNHKLKETNADEIKGYSYIWNINRDNYKDVMPSITLYSKKYVFNYENEFVKKIIYFGTIIGIIVLVGGSSYLYFKNKQNKLNEI